MSGVYSIAEVIDDSNKKPDKTILCILSEDGKDKFSNSQIKSLEKVKEMVIKNGAKAILTKDIKDVITLII